MPAGGQGRRGSCPGPCHLRGPAPFMAFDDF